MGHGKSAAPHVMELAPEDFASDWESRPVVSVPVGLRLPSEDDVQNSRIQADRYVASLGLSDPEAATQAWNDALMAYAVARCICDPFDVRSDSPVLQMAEDTIMLALTPLGIRRIFDELERLMASQSPLVREANDEELSELADRIILGEAQAVTGADGRTLRRFAAYCLDLLPKPD